MRVIYDREPAPSQHEPVPDQPGVDEEAAMAPESLIVVACVPSPAIRPAPGALMVVNLPPRSTRPCSTPVLGWYEPTVMPFLFTPWRRAVSSAFRPAAGSLTVVNLPPQLVNP
jgi:hypothetical protein